jgi:Cd2+/Zn2+-exporting ATPase
MESQMKEIKSSRREVLYDVSGMDCADEIAAVKKALDLPGVVSVDANLMRSTVSVIYTDLTTEDTIRRGIERAGLRIADGDSDESASSGYRLLFVIASGLMVAAGFAAEYWAGARVISLVLNLGAMAAGGFLVFPKAFAAVRNFRLDMNVLMTVASIGAIGIGEYSEAATVVFLFSLSELLEAYSVERARRAIRDVLDLAPAMAAKVTYSGTEEVSVDELEVGDLIRIKAGDRIPMDGSVEKGRTSVNQAPLTGESLPVEKTVGDQVLAGTINEDGTIDVKITALASESKLAQVVKLVEGAQESKAPSERFVDQFARYYTPAVFVVAILALLLPPLLFGQDWNVWIYRSLVLLVVACPCALVLATPVSIVSGLTAMARRGVLVKGGASLEALGRLRAIALDKTGTITEGRPTVHKVIPFGECSENQLLAIAGAIEMDSTHPLARAVVLHAGIKKVEITSVANFKNIPGFGAEGEVAGQQYFLGNHRFAHKLGACSEEVEKRIADVEAAALSVIVVGKKIGSGTAEAIGIIGLGDTIRSGAREAVDALHKAGIEQVVMLSGDNQQTASAVASSAGIDKAIGGLLPDDKVAKIEDLLKQHTFVGMVGDGINDAPALALASVGIAMGAAGTDTAIETADVALMKDDLSQVSVAISQGKRALRVVQFNIAFALLVKGIFLILAITGNSNLWFAVLADTGASILVILNALRLLRV